MFGTDRNDDPFAEIDSANANGSRNPYLLDGQFHLKIKKVQTFTSRQKVLFFLVEMEILASTNLERPEGMTITWMTKLTAEMGAVNVKRFLAAASGIDPDSPLANQEINSEVARYACSADQPLTGAELLAQCVTIQTKKGDPFLDCKWIPIAQPETVG